MEKCYIAYKLKNPGAWVGRGMKIIQLDYMQMNPGPDGRFDGGESHKLWDALKGSADKARFDVKILEEWNADAGEVRLEIPALFAGAGA